MRPIRELCGLADVLLFYLYFLELLLVFEERLDSVVHACLDCELLLRLSGHLLPKLSHVYYQRAKDGPENFYYFLKSLVKKNSCDEAFKNVAQDLWTLKGF